MFLKNLDSKANSVAASLHDVSAGAAINEDYASVVSTSQTLLGSDSDIDFLIVMKNDGFAMIIEQNRWKLEPNAHAYWLNQKRDSYSGISIVPQFNRRIFHYAKPFDYSGIEWGWIHVGLSLDDYDKNVVNLYQNTIMLALGCAILSLLVSLIYAKKLVQPLLRLRQIVRQIAYGDLSVRADVSRYDELGSLAESVNAMTEALLRRDRIMESVRFSSQTFMQSSGWEAAIMPVLSKIGQATGASQAYIFKNSSDNVGRLLMSLEYEWMANESSHQLSGLGIQNLCYIELGLETWIEILGNNEIISGPVSKMSASVKAAIKPLGVLSFIIIPVFMNGAWWGGVGLNDNNDDRAWTKAEKDSLRAAADMLGATIARQHVQEALLESKTTLEHRVLERTQELNAQVIAKEEAMIELSAAQGSLLEMSRAAGMAEVATGVLHNVGNVLNSVNVSCTLLMDQLRVSRVGNVAKVAGLINETEDDLGCFLTQDPRGQKIPVYLTSLAGALQEEHQLMSSETALLHDRIEHIKEIVTMQQTYGRVSGVLENIPPDQLMEEALKLNSDALTRHDITVRQEYQ